VSTRVAKTYLADDPAIVVGLVRFVELRSWDWGASDAEIDAALHRFRLGSWSRFDIPRLAGHVPRSCQA